MSRPVRPAGPSPALALKRLTPGDADPVIVIDFLRVSSTPRLSTMLAGVAGGHPVFAVDPAADLARHEAFVPLAALAAGYAGAIRSAVPGADRVAVIGYCAAAALTLRVAAELAAAATVRVILTQPSWPDNDMIGTDLAGMRADLGGTGGVPADLDGEPGATLAHIVRLLRADIQAMAAARGLAQTPGVTKALADLLDRYRAWLGFMLASRGALEQPWNPGVPVDVLAGTASPAAVPGLGPQSYAVTRLALPNAERQATELLARSALALVDGALTQIPKG